MQSLEQRLKQLERSAPHPARVALLVPDVHGRYPEPPAGAVKVIRVEFVEVAHAKP